MSPFPSTRGALHPSRSSRRSVIRGLAVVPLGLVTRDLPARATLLPPRARVSAPRIQRQPGCRASASVVVDLTNLMPVVAYELTGDLLEWDEPDDDPDLCCHFNALTLPLTSEPARQVLLTAHVLASQLGLVKGAGPARDETFSPDLVELIARVWLRDLATETTHGPWDSPVRVAVSNANRAWTPEDEAPANVLQTPRGDSAEGASPAFRQPPRACFP